MNHRKTLLAASIVAGLCLSVGAYAQDNSQNQNSNSQSGSSAGQTSQQRASAAQAKNLGTVTVTGIRASLEKSLDTKRNSDEVSDAITAEDIGKFPNTNVAEAMSLMPGVTIDRLFGQGDRVSIDGTDPDLNMTFLDGHPVAQAIWRYGANPERGFDFTMLAPELVGRLEVIKSSEARLPEGSLGGTVLLHSRKPLDMKANTISGTASYDYNDQASSGKPNLSGFYSWKNDQNTFGFDVGVQHYEEQIDRQGLEVFGYTPVSAFAAVNPRVAAQVASGVLKPTDMVPQEVNSAWFQQTRKRNSALFNLQFKPNDQFSADLSGLYIRENFANYNQSMYNFMTQNNGSLQSIDYFDPSVNGVVPGGHVNANSGGGGIFYDNNVRPSVVTTKGVDLKADYKGDGWSLGGQAGISKADNPDVGQYFIEPVYGGAYSWGLRQGFQADDPAAFNNPSNWGNIFANTARFSSHSKDRYAQLDFSKNFDSVVNEVLFGVRYTKHNENYGLSVFGKGGNTGNLGQVGTIGNTDTLGSFPGIYGNAANHVQPGAGNVQNWIYNSPIQYGEPDPGSTLNNTWQLVQKDTAAYIQANYSTDVLRGNFGVRWVHTQTASTAYNIPNGATPVLPAPAGWWATNSSTKNNFLPSFNIVYDNGGDVVLRGAVSKVMAWAPYNLMVNQTFLNDTVLTGAGGNPNINPYKSYNFNVSAEWYFAPQSVLSASVFYKHVLNYVFQTPATERLYNSNHDNNPAQFATLIGTSGCTADGFCNYTVTRPHNEGGAKIKGFTLTYQQAFGDSGFGMLANYTFATGKTAQGTGMPYLSRHTISVSPYYENGPFSARVNYNFRSHYLGVGYVAGAAPATTDDYTDISASVGWVFNDHYSLTFDAMNLLNQKYFQYQNVDTMPVNKYTTGRRYMASFHVKF